MAKAATAGLGRRLAFGRRLAARRGERLQVGLRPRGNGVCEPTTDVGGAITVASEPQERLVNMRPPAADLLPYREIIVFIRLHLTVKLICARLLRMAAEAHPTGKVTSASRSCLSIKLMD